MKRPPMIETNHSNPFAHHTLLVRVPKTIRDIQAMNPDYSHEIKSALDSLHDEITSNQLIGLLQFPAPDYEGWAEAWASKPERRWLDTDWFFAETYFYRRVIEAVRWWETGRDPFLPKKEAELESEALWEILPLAAESEDLEEVIGFALWGNRIDLSYVLSQERGVTAQPEDLLVDDRETLIAHLHAADGTVHFIIDNTGTELAMDLVLADYLLRHEITEKVILHVKMHPTFVSDATTGDVLTLLEYFQRRGFDAIYARLQGEMTAGRLRIAPDLYWNSSRLLWDLPERIHRMFESAQLVIVKGDANYRRMVGDAIWASDTRFEDVLAYFPAPIAALRTLKSDPIVGLPTDMDGYLEQIDPNWRTNGQRGVIHFRR